MEQYLNLTLAKANNTKSSWFPSVASLLYSMLEF